MQKTIVTFGLPVAALAMLGAAGVHISRRNQTEPSLEPPLTPVRAAYSNLVAAIGVAESQTENISIGSALSGVVLEVFVPAEDVGRTVTAGTPLFRIDDRHLQAELELARAKAAASQASLAKLESMPRKEELPPSAAKVRAAKTNVAKLADEFHRAEQTFSKATITESEFIAKKLAFQHAEHQLAQATSEHELLASGAWEPDKVIARASVNQAEAEVQRIETEIERAVVRAPVDCQVLQVNVRPGQKVTGTESQPLVVLGDTRELRVRVEIDEDDIPRFSSDEAATAYVRGAPDRPIRLHFRRIEPLVREKRALSGMNTERVDTRILQAVYSVESSDVPLYVGQQLNVFIESQSQANRDQVLNRQVARSRQ